MFVVESKLAEAAKQFISNNIDIEGGKDPVAALYGERRAAYSLFTRQLSDKACEGLRSYLFGRPIPHKPGDAPIYALNLVNGEWLNPGELVTMYSPADRRIALHKLARSKAPDVAHCIDQAHAFWTSFEWANEGLAYRKHVIKNFSRILNYFYDECLDELRQQTPKTRLEADKDFWEAKRAADHLEGNAEKAMTGDVIPTMIPGQEFWKDAYLPAGVCTVITPMNFVYGISGIQIVGCYLSGSPMIFKGHPFCAITNTTLIKMLIAAGADPRAVHKIEGFGGDISTLTSDPRIAVVSVTGSAETARAIQNSRGLRPTRFEGGGCNWSYIDDGYNDDELNKIAVRLSYSKLGLGSHKCTSLHGIAASKAMLDRLEPMLKREFANYKVTDPRLTADQETKVVGPLMVHKASTVDSIRESAIKAGVSIVLDGGKVANGDYAEHAEVVRPMILGRVTPETTISVNWDGKEARAIRLATTEFFMPILVTMELDSFDAFVHFCIVTNPNDLAVSVWTRDDLKINRARRTLAGMLKENDGTDSALEWEEFGASGIGDSGNSGVGDAETTIAMFCRRQKGRHCIF